MNRLGLGLNRLRVIGILAWAKLVLRLVGVHGYFGASGMGEATPIIHIVIAVHSDHPHRHPHRHRRFDLADLSVFFGGCLF